MSASLYVFSLLFKNLAVFNTTFNIDMLNYSKFSCLVDKIKFMLICIHHFSALVIATVDCFLLILRFLYVYPVFVN